MIKSLLPLLNLGWFWSYPHRVHGHARVSPIGGAPGFQFAGQPAILNVCPGRSSKEDLKTLKVWKACEIASYDPPGVVKSTMDLTCPGMKRLPYLNPLRPTLGRLGKWGQSSGTALGNACICIRADPILQSRGAPDRSIFAEAGPFGNFLHFPLSSLPTRLYFDIGSSSHLTMW